MADWVTPELLETLLDRHGAALELFVSQWTTAPQDCVQDAFIQFVRQPESPDCVAAWLFRVARNRAISMKRSADRRKRHELAASEERPASFLPRPDDPFDAVTLDAALRSLSEQHREVIVAKIWGGLSFEQIAVIVGTSRSSAHRRYEAGLAILKKRLLKKRLEPPWPSENNPPKTSMNSNAT